MPTYYSAEATHWYRQRCPDQRARICYQADEPLPAETVLEAVRLLYEVLNPPETFALPVLPHDLPPDPVDPWQAMVRRINALGIKEVMVRMDSRG